MPAPRGASARITAIAVLLALMIGGLFTTTASAQDALTIDLDERNGSGISGTATLTPDGDSTTIRLQLEGPVGDNPVNIMTGTCVDFDALPVYELNPIDASGVSETTIDASIDDLTGDDHVINVHASPTNLGTIYACGAIEASAIDDSGDDADDDQNSASVILATSNNSGVSGTATLTAVGDSRTAVAIDVNGVAGTNLAAIFPGTCDDLDLTAAYDLDDVDGNGVSNTTIDASLASLLNGEYAILVSDPEIALGQGSGLACGEITSSIGGATTGPATGVGVAAIDGLRGPALGFLISALTLVIAAGLLFRKRTRA